MGPFSVLLVYVIGGVTFIPLLLLGALAFFVASTTPVKSDAKPLVDGLEKESVKSQDGDGKSGKSWAQQNEPDVTAAYFAVCREYVPGGINGKPPERSTPAGEVLIAESPSVYQSMYRSIFERGKTQIPTIEGDRKDGKAVKKARNVFFVVLRHGHLMLYDDSEQLEVRHVISLAHHDIDVYGGHDRLTEGDLWIKRNCIRLTRKALDSSTAPLSKPFYLFSDNCSEKEDFYHTLLLYQSASQEPNAPPLPQQFETQHIIKLVQQLYAPDADPNARWLNALIGRLFLAMYKTDDIENYIRAKINRKISRVSKPNFITSIQIQDIDMGDSAPVISNPKLRDMNVNGDTTIEFDIKYNGGFKLQMGAVARIDLGSRLKAREVNLIMSGTLRKLSGHMLVRIKPPPSNRFWLTFENMPHIELSIEPIVSSRQITYGIILRAIESRIREVVGETLVFPNWDDSPFLDTSRKDCRGGIFESNATVNGYPASKAQEAEDHALPTVAHELAKVDDLDKDLPGLSSLRNSQQKTMSMPSLSDPPQKFSLRKVAKKSVTSLAEASTATSTGTSMTGSSSVHPVAASPPSLPSRKPRPMRSQSFASAATPLVSTEQANAEAIKPDSRSKRNSRGAVELVKEVNTRNQSQFSSPTALEADCGSEDVPHFDMDKELLAYVHDEVGQGDSEEGASETSANVPDNTRRLSEPATPGKEINDPAFGTPRSPSTSSIPINGTRSPSIESSSKLSSQSAPSTSHLSTAANAAKKWGLGVLHRQSAGSSITLPSGSSMLSTSSVNSTRTSSSVQPSLSLSPNQSAPSHAETARALPQVRGGPMGRGQPLPPPGMPLPGPRAQKSLWSASSLNLGIGSLKRKPVPGPPLPPRSEEHSNESRKVPPALPARNSNGRQLPQTRSTVTQDYTTAGEDPNDSMLVVTVPEEDEDNSMPTTPIRLSFDGSVPTHGDDMDHTAVSRNERIDGGDDRPSSDLLNFDTTIYEDIRSIPPQDNAPPDTAEAGDGGTLNAEVIEPGEASRHKLVEEVGPMIAHQGDSASVLQDHADHDPS
ncbi:hypothetical protein AAFC00_005755 [Neodothiora populina]|uniref:SMP-LTD domain-containing protein n=1 Tax=Neodothiora populina TaxID=2781224 RepID=A0ABR3P5W4_9PEZI